MLRLLLWPIYFLSGFFKREKVIYGTYYKNIYSNSFCQYLKLKNGKFISRNKNYFANGSESIYSLKSIYYHLTAKKAYVDYSHQDLLWFLLRGAEVINLWHGMPVKKIEKDIDSGMLLSKYNSSNLFNIINRLKYHPSTFLNYSKVLVNSELHKKLLSNAFNTEELELGAAPRLNLWHKKGAKQRSIWFIYTFLDSGSPPEHLMESLNMDLRENGIVVNSVLHPKDEIIYKKIKNKNNCFLGLDVRHVGENDIIVSEQSSLLFDAAAKKINIVLLKSNKLRSSYFDLEEHFKTWAIIERPNDIRKILKLLYNEKSNFLQQNIKLQC